MSRSTKERQPENRWTPEEDEVLLNAIEKCGSIIIWSQVSACLPGRNNKSCRKRWIHSLDPTLRKGRWTEEEDEILMSAIETHGTHWFQVAKLLPGRTDDQCAKRWRENLDPAISRKAWTPEEDEVLMQRYERLGKCWKDIASCFEGRPPVHCRNRVQSLVRARRRAAKAKNAVKGKGRGKRSAYDALMDAEMPHPASGSTPERWEEIKRSSTTSTLDSYPDSLEGDSSSSTASGEISTYDSAMFSNSIRGPSQESKSSPTIDLQLERYLSQANNQSSFDYSIPSLASTSSSQLNWGSSALDTRYHTPIALASESAFGANFSESFGPWAQPRSDAPFDTGIQLSFASSNSPSVNNFGLDRACIPTSISRRRNHHYHPYPQQTEYQHALQEYRTAPGVTSLNLSHGNGHDLLHPYLDQPTWNVAPCYSGMSSSSSY